MWVKLEHQNIKHNVFDFQALSAVNKHDLSAALFANGWVYEKWGKENFVQNESKLVFHILQ